MNEIIQLILWTLAPFLELRASIPWGILKTDLHWASVFFICIIVNILLCFFVWFFIHYIMCFFLKIKFIEKIYHRIIERTQRKVDPYIKKYGKIGLGLFIGIPLPGSGVYSGGLGAYLLGFKFKDYIIASIIGVLIAGTIVLLISLFGNGFLNYFIKVV